MSTDMPQFVMPPPVQLPARPSDAEVAPEAEGPALAGPSTVGAAAPPRPRSTLVRALIAAGLAGLILGAGVQAGVHGAAGSASQARAAAVEAAAMDYLTAIAQGRAADASALVPPTLRGQLAPDAVLDAARPIRDYRATAGSLEGGAATVLVEYAVGGLQVERVLRAEQQGQSWRITTSLAEIPSVYQDHQLAAVSVGGVELEQHRRLLLYPGAYVQDVVDTGLYRSVGNAFVIDGDPASVTEIWSGLELDLMVATIAADLAIDIVRACQAADTCGVSRDASVRQVEEPQLRSVNPLTGGIDISATIAIGDRWAEVRLRAVPDRLTGGARWQCPEPDRLDLPIVPCER